MVASPTVRAFCMEFVLCTARLTVAVYSAATPMAIMRMAMIETTVRREPPDCFWWGVFFTDKSSTVL
jgi:hypothetical protein